MKQNKLGFLVICLLFFAIFLSGVTYGINHQNTPFSSDTEFYYRLNLSRGDVKNVLGDFFNKIQNIDILEPKLENLIKETGINPEKDIFSWLGNQFQMGIVGKRGHSVLGKEIRELAQYKKSKGQLKKTIRLIRRIRNRINFYKEKHKRLPESINEVMPKGIKPPRGGKFIYKTYNNNKEYEITVFKNQFIDLGLKGELPKYYSSKGFRGIRPKKKKHFKLSNVLVVIDVKNTVKAKKFLNKLQKTINTKWKNNKIKIETVKWKNYYIYCNSTIKYSLANNRLLISDKISQIKSAILVMEGTKSPLYQNKTYQHFAKNQLSSKNVVEEFFLDLNKLYLSPKMFDVKNQNMKEIVNALYYLGYSSIYNDTGFKGDIILQLNPKNKVSILKNYFTKTSQYQGQSLQSVPAGLPIAVSYNIGEIWNFLEIISKNDKDIQEGLNGIKAALMMALELDLEKDILKSTSGEFVLSYKPRNMILAIFEQIFKKIRGSGYLKDSNQISSGNMEINSSNSNRQISMRLRPRRFFSKNIMKNVPFTFFFPIKNKEKIQKLMGALKEKTGKFQEIDYKGVKIYKSRKIAYALTEHLLVIQTLCGTNSIKNYIDMLQNGQFLGNNTHYNLFKEGVKGRVILMQYQNMEWASSIMKGTMLFFLPELSSYAEKIGYYKESWSSVSVNPDNLQIHFMLYKKPVSK